MYFHSVHGKNIQLSADNSQAKRINGFCEGITFSSNPLTQLQRVTFIVANEHSIATTDSGKIQRDNSSTTKLNYLNKKSISKRSNWSGNLRIGVTTKNPTSLISTELPEFSYPTLLNTEGYWITCIKSSYLKSGNKISLVLDKTNSLQLAVNYVVKATLFDNDMIPNTPTTKLWLILDIYGATNFVQFLPSDETPYEIKERGLDAINNFHSACLSGGSKSIYKTRLLILGQDDAGKISLKNALVNLKKKSASGKKNIDLSASFRVKVDSKSNWHLKAINKYDLNNERKKTANKYYKLGKNLSQSTISLDQMSKANAKSNNLENAKALTSNLDVASLDKFKVSKRKSSSTSYLNEEDDYDDDYLNNHLRHYSHDIQMKELKLKSVDHDDLAISKRSQKQRDHDEKKHSLTTQNSINENDEDPEQNVLAQSLNDIKSSESSSANSSRKNSDFEDDENDADLYAIDEYDEVFPSLDDSSDLKKDPTGYYYKKIAVNIYKELFMTKLWDKLWPASNDVDMKLDGLLNFNSSTITETIFEKIAIMEFEASIYNQLSCSKILLFYFQQIVCYEIKMIRNKPSRTILVSPVEKNESSHNDSDYFSTNMENLKLLRKKLSLTICDFADQSYQILLSSRAVYIVCFDLSKELNELSDTNFEFGSKKNEEMTNLDYLDFVFKSIHYNTAKITAISPLALTNTNSNVSSMVKIKTDDDEKTNFKVGTMSPPILLVGTNKNSLSKFSNAKDLIKQKFDRIKEFISNKIYASHILEPFYAIENNIQQNENSNQDIPSELAKNELDSLRDLEILKHNIQIAALSEPYMGEQQPLKWMKFERSLEKLKNKGLFYASLSQICEIAHEKDIKTQEELTTCLNFLNDLGQIIYYGNANDIFLRNTIILRPQKLIEIFNMVLDAKIPTSFNNKEALPDVTTTHDTTTPTNLNNNSNVTPEWTELWEKFDQRGILDDKLLDFLWKNVINQKPGLLGLMKKFDLICERNLTGIKLSADHLNREYLVSSRAKVVYDEEMLDANVDDESNNADYDDRLNSDDDSEESTDSYFRRREQKMNNHKKNKYFNNNNNALNVEFYYDFCGFLPESLFHRIITRAARWTLMKTGANPKNAVSMYYRKARFYLNECHYFTIEMAPIKYARIKIEISSVSVNNGFVNEPSPPDPNACAKVRNFMETTLIDLRNLWMKRLMFYACVQCSCDKVCEKHQLKICSDIECMHFLNLDECLTNNIVTCDYRRVKTLVYKSWFPTQNISLHKGPVLAAVKTYSDKNMFYDENSLPNWVKNVAKLLQTYGKDKDKDKDQVVTVHNENDWLALARLLGYSKSKINYFNESDSPALQLICDWIMSSDNTNLTIEFLLNYLEQIKREDVIKIINNEREKETVNSSIFISYHWDSQEFVIKIKEHLEKAGFNCFMDIGQIGGGNLLYQKIDQAIRNAKVVIACITPKFVVSHYCNREMALADLLRKPIVPIMLTLTPWPPPGGMGLIFSQLVYVDYFGVGGHGGCGINADRDQRNNEIVAMVSRHINPSSYFLMNIDRLTDNNDKYQNNQHKQKKNFLEQLKPSQLIRNSSQYYNSNNRNNNVNQNQMQHQFIDEVNTRRNYLSHHQSHLMNQQIAAQNAHRGGNRTPQQITSNRTNNNRSDSNQVGDVPRCAVCCLL